MIFLSVIILLWIILWLNYLFIWLFNIDLFYYFNKEIILYWCLILSIIYIFYFLVIDIDKQLSWTKQAKIVNNMDFLILTILLLSFVFWPLYSRFIDNELFLRIFMKLHNLTLYWFITTENIKILLVWIKYFVIFINIWSSIFILWLLDRLLYPRNIINFIKKMFSFNPNTIWQELKEEKNKWNNFIIKRILINIIKLILFGYNKMINFINNITNHQFSINLSHQIVPEDPQSINYKNKNINSKDDIYIYPSDYWTDENIDNSKLNFDNNSKNIKDVVIWNVTNPMDPNVIQNTTNLNQQLENENPNIINNNIVSWVDLTIPFKKLESVNFPINLIKTWELYFENNCIFLDKDSLKYKDYIIKYYNSIINDKNNIKRIEDTNWIFIIIYYDPVYGLILMPKIIERRSITNMSADIVKYFNQIFFKLDFFPTELKEFFIDYTTSIEKIQNTIVYYIVAKHEYDGKKRQECKTQYKSFLLKDIYTQIWSENYKEKLNYLQSMNKDKYLQMNSDERLTLLKEKYWIFFWKRKLSFAKDIDINYDWKKTSDKLIFNETIYSAKHLALLWKTWWWKTVLLKNIIYSFLSKNEIDWVDFYMIDPKTELIKEFYNYKQVKYISTDLDKHKNLLKYLVHIMTERQSQIQKWDWTETFEATWKLFKPIVLVIEEFIDLNTELDNFSKSLITKLLVKGRSSGIYIIAIAQYYRTKVFGAVWSQLTLMSVFNEDPETSKKMTWNESYLSKLWMGEMLYTDTFNQMYVRVPYEMDYEWYLDKWMLRYQVPDDNSWKEQRLKFNIDFFNKIIKLYIDWNYSIATTSSLLFNERVSWTNEFLKFELVYIYVILTKDLSSISFTDLIVRTFIVKTLLSAIDERKQQFNIHEVIASNDVRGFLKNIKTEIVNDFNQLFEKNIDILPNKKLFDRNVIKKLANARDEADPWVIEELEMKIDPEVKIETIIKILNKLIDGFNESIIYEEADKFINFFQDNINLLMTYLQLLQSSENEIRNIQIDSNLSNEEKINTFINKITLIIKREKKKNANENNKWELEQAISEDIDTLNEKYLEDDENNELNEKNDEDNELNEKNNLNKTNEPLPKDVNTLKNNDMDELLSAELDIPNNVNNKNDVFIDTVEEEKKIDIDDVAEIIANNNNVNDYSTNNGNNKINESNKTNTNDENNKWWTKINLDSLL